MSTTTITPAIPGIENDWYREIVETAPDATVMIDSDGRIVLINRQTEILFGYERKELLGELVEVLVPDRYRGKHHIHRDGYFGDPNMREMGAGLELSGVRKDGTEFPVEISLSPLRTDRGVFATAAIRDATARRAAEAQFKNLLETAPDAMVIINRQGVIELVNAQTERMFGYKREALVGRPVEVLVPETLRDQHLAHRRGYFVDPKVREMGAGLELSGRRKDGSEFPIEISLSPLETDEGRLATAAIRDITDRKKSQEQMRNLLETAPDAMIIIDQRGTIKLVNAQTERLFGFPRDALIDQPVEILVPARLHDKHVGHRKGYFTDPKIREMGAGLELWGSRQDGTEFPIEISLSPLDTEEGRFATAAVRDITNRKKSQEQMRNLLETAPDAMVIIDQTGHITLVNRQTERLFGYDRDELIRQPVEILVPERLRDRHLGHRTGYFVDPKVREMGAGLELWGRRADGSEFPIEISLSPLETEEGRFATAAVRDITDRKKAQAQFKNLLETAPDAMVIIDRNGRINLVNQQTERLFGYTRGELIDQPVEILVPENLRSRHVGHRSGYFGDPKVREMGAGLELSGRRKDGTEFPIEISLSPLETPDGQFATAAVRDITERKTAQIKLTDYARNLEASNRELEEFAYVASHDLQAPLRNIISFSELLHDECVGKISEDADRYFGFIEEGALRLQGLIKDILEVSRVNRMERSFITVDTNECMETCRLQLRSVLEDSGGRIDFARLPDVKGDALRLTQLFQNLLNNAVKFQRPGVPPLVTITARRFGEFWEFAIADNGIGISADECVQVFEIFRRLHTADEYPGTGIGLSICKKIVETHGGRIWAESEPGKGATFRFTLPDTATVLAPEQAHA